jgi:hypothetical protein
MKEHPSGDLKDIIEDANNKTKSVIGNRFFPTNSFLKLLNNLLANNLSKVYVFNNSLSRQKENIIDKYLFARMLYILQFDITD